MSIFEGVELWSYVQEEALDDRTAIEAGHVDEHGNAALHGTYVKFQYFTILQDGPDNDRDAKILVFDDQANFCGFDKQADNLAWVASKEAFIVNYTGGTYSDPANPKLTFSVPSLTLNIPPTLVLAIHDKDSAPINIYIGKAYVSHVANATTLSTWPSKLEYVGNNKLKWSAPGFSGTLNLTPQNRMEGVAPNAEKSNTFSDTFTGKSDFAQVDFPFYGFNPLAMTVYTEAGAYMTPGTTRTDTAYPSNPGQTFTSPLIFKFPLGESYDYSMYPNLPHQPNMAIGRRGILIDLNYENEHSRMLSTLDERTKSWSATLGFNGDVDKLLSAKGDGTYKTKMETQKSTESRYSVVRSVEIYWASIADIPSLTLKEELVDWIKTNTYRKLSGHDVDWSDFINSFGSHYAHTITQGSLSYTETRFSLNVESKAIMKGIDLKMMSKGILDGGKIGGKDAISSEWSKKHGITIEAEDIESFSVGAKENNGLSIFFDLRPLTELLNPFFFPYNPSDDWLSLAPWVWTTMRQELDNYLLDQGLDQTFAESLKDDYSPRLVTVTLPNVKLVVDDERWFSGGVPNREYAWGEIKWVNMTGDFSGKTPSIDNDNGYGNPNDTQVVLNYNDWSPQGKAYISGNDGFQPTPQDAFCTLALRRGAVPHVTLDLNSFYTSTNSNLDEDIPGDALFSGSLSICQDMSKPVMTGSFPSVKVQEVAHLSIWYTLTVDYKLEENQWIKSAATGPS